MPTTLVAVSGMSPAIITETLWALAHEKPAVIPDEVVVITTSKGEADIKRDLLTKHDSWGGKNVWETLCAEILRMAALPRLSDKLQLSIRVISLPDAATKVRQPAVDLRTQAHHKEAADFIIQALSPICDAADQHVIASIAGGRKTMGALLYAAMSLLGKETDRVTHVLVNEPFDSVRGFFYPRQPVDKLTARLHGQEPFPISTRDAHIELADIPFVPLRNKFDELKERRTFSGLVETYSLAARQTAAGPPVVQLDEEQGIFTVQGRPIKLAGRDLLVTTFLFQRAQAGERHLANKDEAAGQLPGFNAQWKRNHPCHNAVKRLSADGISEDDIPKALSSLRKKLTEKGLVAYLPYLAPLDARIGFDTAAD